MDKNERSIARIAEIALNKYYKEYCIKKNPPCLDCEHNLGSHCVIKEAIRTIGQRIYLESE